MKKSTKLIFSIIIIILTIALCIMTYLFIYAKNAANENLQHVLDAGEKVFELNSKIEELEEQLANTATISSVTNTTNSYNPMGVSIANKSVDNTVVEPQNYSRKPELVTLEVDTDTLSKIGVTLIITDNNETSYG